MRIKLKTGKVKHSRMTMIASWRKHIKKYKMTFTETISIQKPMAKLSTREKNYISRRAFQMEARIREAERRFCETNPKPLYLQLELKTQYVDTNCKRIL